MTQVFGESNQQEVPQPTVTSEYLNGLIIFPHSYLRACSNVGKLRRILLWKVELSDVNLTNALWSYNDSRVVLYLYNFLGCNQCDQMTRLSLQYFASSYPITTTLLPRYYLLSRKIVNLLRSVNFSAPFILQSEVRIPNTPSTLSPFQVKYYSKIVMGSM